MRCARVALGQTTVLASEMESARRTALAVLARRHHRADSASKADRTDRADRKDRSPTADRAEGPAMNVNLVQSGGLWGIFRDSNGGVTTVRLRSPVWRHAPVFRVCGV